MENLYTSYIKVIEEKTFYFVKRFLAFPEFKDVAPVLESYGMHTDFNKACSIAGVTDVAVKERLLKEAEESLIGQQAKVIDLNAKGFNQSIAL